MRISILLSLMVIFGRFAFDIYVPALPEIQSDFSSSDEAVQLSITLFSLGFGASQLFYGPASDRYGRRPVLFFGLVLFIVGGILAFYAGSLFQLNFARLILGWGSGVGVVLARAISRDLFSGTELAKIVSTQTLVITSALFLAPILGGYLMHFFSWRVDFAFLIFLGIFSLLIFFIFLPESNQKHRYNTLFLAFKSYVLIAKNKSFLFNAIIISLAFSGLVIYFQLTPFIFQEKYGLSVIAYSWLSLVVSTAYLFGTVIVNRQLKYYSMSHIIAQGCLLMFVSGLGIIFFYCLHGNSLLELLIFSSIYIIGLRLVFPTATANCMEPFKTRAGTAAAFLGGTLMGVVSTFSYLASIINFDDRLILGLMYFISALLSFFFLYCLSIQK